MPLRNPQVLTKRLDIGNEVLGGVFAKFAAGRGFAGAALVEEDDAVVQGVEVDGAGGGGAATGAAVEEDDWVWGVSGGEWWWMWSVPGFPSGFPYCA